MMPAIKAIQIKALFMLTVFTVNLYAVCHCHHKAIRQKTEIAATHCSHCHQPGTEKQKDGCCTDHVLQFSFLDKMTAARIAMTAYPAQEYIQPFTFEPLSLGKPAKPAQTWTGQWQRKHAPPDLLALYQTYRI